MAFFLPIGGCHCGGDTCGVAGLESGLGQRRGEHPVSGGAILGDTTTSQLSPSLPAPLGVAVAVADTAVQRIA